MFGEGGPKMAISHSDRVDLWRLKSIMQFYAPQLFLDAPYARPWVFSIYLCRPLCDGQSVLIIECYGAQTCNESKLSHESTFIKNTLRWD